ncbi:hypothetical protein CXB51_004491 [Gossypium anomalum]|uniref:Reverse transcriptase zinc-binding domain-containing protein n=1 Tax=Gossypium anomalum TaxID=47600 RepID=A0A8J5Z1B1_9ROSI|nr:hypothetical protein CXB51_004491 [Gossypium anomalum]
MDVAEKILKIPLAEIAYDDFQVWRGKLTGEFSVRSAYKLLHEICLDPTTIILQTEIRNFYRKLWKSHIPLKIQITVWRVSWNFIPSLVNLRLKRVVVDAQCPRCHQGEEDSTHIFQQCPSTIEVWNQLRLAWVLSQNNLNMWQWLTWVFDKGTDEQLRLFCCGLWLIWFSRNKLLYERRHMTGIEIARQTRNYMVEPDAIEEKRLTSPPTENTQQICRRGRVTVYFDAAFDRLSSRSSTGLLVRNEEG